MSGTPTGSTTDANHKTAASTCKSRARRSATCQALAVDRPGQYSLGTRPRRSDCGEGRSRDHRQLGAVVVPQFAALADSSDVPAVVRVADIEFSIVLDRVGISERLRLDEIRRDHPGTRQAADSKFPESIRARRSSRQPTSVDNSAALSALVFARGGPAHRRGNNLIH
jgi:hypothetical protein